jgi:hypothetical protein
MRELLERAEAVLSDVASDTHYGIHDGDFSVPYGAPRLAFMEKYDDCTCALCSIRKFLAENPTG